MGYSPWVAKSQTQLSNFTSLKGTFLAKMGSIKDRNGMDITEAEDVARIDRRTVQKRSSRPR